MSIRIVNHENRATIATVAIVVSRFNQFITEPLLEGCLAELKNAGLLEHHITVVWVPGAVEIPLVCQQLAVTGRYDALIALGAVIRGETGHYDLVCQQVSDGCAAVMLQQNIPVIFGVLTTDTVAQAQDRIGGSHGHKGKAAARAAIEMCCILRDLS